MVELIYNVGIFGESNVGKTKLMISFTTDSFYTPIPMTIDTSILNRKILFKGREISYVLYDMHSDILQRPYLAIRIPLDGALLLFDITKSSVDNFDLWVNIITGDFFSSEDLRVPLIILVGSKLDLANERMVDQSFFKKLVAKNDHIIDYIECSALSRENLDTLFNTLSIEILRREKLI